MKKILLSISFLLTIYCNAQVGINTDQPQSTLEVVGDPTNISKFDGIIAPKITGSQLRLKTYTATQNGSLLYVTEADSSPSGQTINVIAPGYYYFNGEASSNRWIRVAEQPKIRTMSSGTVGSDDFTILVTGNISLPAPSSANLGKVYNLVNDTSSSVTVSGTFRINGGNFSNYGLNTGDQGKAVSVQSTGSAWVVLSRY